jgi:hypothetical protein
MPEFEQVENFKLDEDSFLLYVTKLVDLWNGRGSSSILLSVQRKGGRDDRAEARHQPIEPQ